MTRILSLFAPALFFLAFFLLAPNGALSGEALAAPAAADPAKASLAVTIENLSSKGGMLRLGLYTEDTYYDDNAEPVAELDVRATPPTQHVVFNNVPPGVYAIQVFQDFNGNFKMDFSLLGLPLEPYGFSRDGRAFLSRPAFSRVKLTLAPGINPPQTIHLQNSDAPAR